MMKTTKPALALLLAATLPAGAAEFSPPEGCDVSLTVQSRSCSVSLIWQCDVTPSGDFWEATFSQDGLDSIVSYSADYQWLDAVYMWDGSREELVPPAADPVSLSNLTDTGIDTFDFTMRRTQDDRSYDIRIVGADMLTGEAKVIDGFTLERVQTRIEIIADDGTVEYRASGTQYLSRSLGQFFLGEETVIGDDGSAIDYVDTPVDIILPGEPGFGGTTPLYDCNQQKAGFTPDAPTPAQQEMIHDEI